MDNIDPKDGCSMNVEPSTSSNKKKSSSSNINSSTNSNEANSYLEKESKSSLSTWEESKARKEANKKAAEDMQQSLEDKAKSIIDKIFDPLDGGDSYTYYNSGYSSSYVENNEGEIITTISYDIVNLDPNNQWDIYYRDDEEYLWQKNRDAHTYEIGDNIYKIHKQIVEPIRERASIMFGDKVLIRVENCFMCLDSLIKYDLPSDHLFSKAKAVLLRIEGQRASMIYDDIMQWCADDSDDDIDMGDIKPITYGMMKLCNTEEKEQRIYITLPFSKEELEEDELLMHNKSNFYYTEANAYLMAPDANTSTKIFPSYQVDNEVESMFNKVDDLDEEIKKLDKTIEQAKELKNKTMLNNALNEKYKLEFEKKVIEEGLNYSELEYKLNEAEYLYSKNKSDDNLTKVEDIKKEIDKLSFNGKTLNEIMAKLDTLSIELSSKIGSSNNFNDYFDSHKLLFIKLFIDRLSLNNDVKVSEDIKNIIDEKLIEENKNIELIEDEDNFDILDKLKSIYLNKEFDEIYKIPLNLELDISNMEEKEFLKLENIEYNKFSSLSELININDKFIENIFRLSEVNNICTKINYYIMENNIDSIFNHMLYNKVDIEIIKNYYFKSIKNMSPNLDGIDLKIKRSSIMSNHLNKLFNNDFLVIPQENSKDYSEYVMNYLEAEINTENDLLIENFGDQNRIDFLISKKEEYSKYIESENYSNINLSDIKSDIYQFTDIEYSAAKLKFLKVNYEDNNLDNIERSIYKISYEILNNKLKFNSYPYYSKCNEIGKYSLDIQIIKYYIQEFLEDKDKWRSDNNITISETINEQLKCIINIINENINAFNKKIDNFNNCLFEFLNSDIELFSLDKEFKKSFISYNYTDYGYEYISLDEDIYDLKIKDEKNNSYDIELKQQRLNRKRTLDYLLMSDVDKKITHYEDEALVALNNNKINRYNQIIEKILPEIIRAKKLKEDFINNYLNNEDDNFINIKLEEKGRLEYIHSIYPDDPSIAYNYVTSDTRMDFMYNKGPFNNEFLTEDEKYKMFINSLIDELNKSNIPIVKEEIPYLEEELKFLIDKPSKIEEFKNNLNKKKKIINEELSKRFNDLNYLHKCVWVSFLEEYMKLKYKDQIIISSTPSKGVVKTYPFLLYEEFKDIYIKMCTFNKNINDYEVLYAYRKYCELPLTYFNLEKNKFLNSIYKLWENFYYSPTKNSMTIEINKYLLLFDDDVDSEISKYIYDSLLIVNGIINIESVILSDNEREYNGGLHIHIRRTSEFIDDLKNILIRLFKKENINKINFELRKL